jgi:hypothetical protein
MAKFYSVLAGGLLSLLALRVQPVAAQAQQVPPHRTCATEEVNKQIQAELVRTIPGYNPARSTNSAPPRTQRTAAFTYTLPVVVHVIHNGEAVGAGLNLSQAQIQSQIDVLNEDYRNLNPDGNNTAIVPSVFQPVRGDAQVQFQLAVRDPNGVVMAEPGIDRVNRTTKGFRTGPYTQGYIDGTIKPQTYWNPEQYINIWVMDLGRGLLGYAQFPDNTANLGGLSPLGGLASTDGVVIVYYGFGSRAKNPTGIYEPIGAPSPPNPANPYDKGRTLTHELGHYLSLRHIWGDDDQEPDACSFSDYTSDTPNQADSNYECPSFPHVTCSNGPGGDMFMNYMDYVNDACMAMFSKGQAERIQAVMSSGTPRRANLANSPALCTTVVAATVGSNSAVCLGGTLNLTATGPAGATYSWIGPNGFVSTAQNPVVPNITSAAAGTYLVQVSVATGACPSTLRTTVVVNTPPAAPALTPSATLVCPNTPVSIASSGLAATGTLPSENFNGSAPGWTIGNTGAVAAAWQYSAGYTAPRLGLANYTLDGSRFVIANSDAGGVGSSTNTTLTSPAFSTIGYSTLSVSFLQAFYPYAGVAAATVEASTDGGATWAVVAKYDYELGTDTPVTSTVDLAAYLNKPSVRLRWHYIDVYGAYWAIDNIRFTAAQPAITYAWSVVSGDGLPATATTASITVNPTQSSVYRLSVGFAGSSCTSTSTVSVNVYPTPALVTSVATACPGSPATLSASNTAAIASYSPTYAWSVVSGDGLPAAANSATISVSPTQNSVYRLTVTYPGGCTTAATVSVAAVPAPALVASASVVCAGSAAQLSASNIPTTGYTYAWTLVSGDGLPATVNTPTISVTPTQVSVYRLTVSSGGCSASSTVTVTGVTNQIDAYPVPFGDAGLSLKISTCTAGPATVQIYDMLGRRMYESTVATPQVGITPINMPETGRLRPGKYIVKVQQGSQNTTFNVVRQ